MKIKLELFGASRDLSNKEYLELNIKENISIKDLRKKIINYVDERFKGNENYKKIIETSAFCSSVEGSGVWIGVGCGESVVQGSMNSSAGSVASLGAGAG